MPDLVVTPSVQQLTVTPSVQSLTISEAVDTFQFVGHNTQSSYATATTLLAASAAWYDIVNVTLTAGTWLLSFNLLATTTSNTIELTGRAYDPFGLVEYGGASASGARNGSPVPIAWSRVVTLSALTVISLQASSSGTNGLTVQFITPSQSTTKCTGIYAVQIG